MTKALLLQEVIANKIFLIRGQRVMLDKDIAEMYGVPVKRLNEQVKRNRSRFPEDFMFKLTERENGFLRSQNEALEKGRGKYSKYIPHVFTEHGILMLSSVLNSERAVQVNIMIMRVFVKVRKFLFTHKELARRLSNVEKKMAQKDEQIKAIFITIGQLIGRDKKGKIIKGFGNVKNKAQ